MVTSDAGRPASAEKGGGGMELLVRGDRAVLAGAGERAAGPADADPHSLALGAELAEALHEWARVAAALLRDDTSTPAAIAVVSQRGRQLAGRVAAAMGVPVTYVDPVSGARAVIGPSPRYAGGTDGGVRARIGAQAARVRAERIAEPTPWLTGLTAATVLGIVVVIAMLALAQAVATETSGWLACAAAALVTAGLAPSIWLGRRLVIVRWLAYGAAAGLAVSWIGVLAIAL